MKNSKSGRSTKTSQFSDLQGRRIRLNEEFVLTGISISEWYWQNKEMADAKLYQDRSYLNQRWEREWRSQVGGPSFGYGALQKQMNATMDNILERLKADMPDISPDEFYAYSYFAAGFSTFLVAHLLGLKSAHDASAMKTRLKNELIILRSPYKHEYLELLPVQSCRFGKEMLYLHNCIEAYYGKSEKNQNQGSAGSGAGNPGPREGMGPDQERQ